MKVKIMIMIAASVLLNACGNVENNPLLEKWDTPFGTPPFNEIKNDQHLPAFKEAIELHNAEINKIANSTEEPSFTNTIEAMEYSGETLSKVRNVFNAMTGAMNSEELQKISKEVAPLLSTHKDDINLNASLFSRAKAIYNQRDTLNLTTEQKTLLDKYYKNFVRGGADLNDTDKEILRKLNEELSLLSLQFGENVLAENNKFELIIDNKDDLEGLSESIKDAASETAKEKGYKNKWVFTIHKPSMIPFLQYSTKRELRKQIYTAYFMKGDHNNELDNKKILTKMALLRLKRAKLLGYETHADYVLDEQMAKTPKNVYDLLDKVWEPALTRSMDERTEMQNMIKEEGNNFNLEPWDWWYYAEKVKKVKYNLDENELRPYFEVNNVIRGAFGLATSLFGIQFEERNDIEKYHPDVKVFEVKEADGKHIGILYTDYFPRASKRSGAWMDEFRRQHKKEGKMITPIIYNVGNFSKPTADKPALLSLDEVETLFHEFGHGLHGLLSNCTYPSVAATETPRDFVELPSQVMENWAFHPVVLQSYAKHYETGEIIPKELVYKIENSSLFNQGFATVELVAAAYLDMDWHTITESSELNTIKFENDSMSKIGLIPEIKPRYRSTYFNHIFSGGYSSGYYSYLWAEVLDADAFNAFIESGDVLNKELAAKYRKYILAKGGSEDSMELYKKFRGQEPNIEPLLKRKGLK
ncbi:MAG: M3 family metallopeptidase [Bacteroidota bacterium]